MKKNLSSHPCPGNDYEHRFGCQLGCSWTSLTLAPVESWCELQKGAPLGQKLPLWVDGLISDLQGPHMVVGGRATFQLTLISMG